MGETANQPFQLSFNACLKVDFQGSRVTSDGGLILIRELDERLGMEKLIAEQLSDSRQGLNKQFTLADLLRQSVYSRLAGYEDLNDAERLASDTTFRLISSQRIWERAAALPMPAGSGAASAAKQPGESNKRGPVSEKMLRNGSSVDWILNANWLRHLQSWKMRPQKTIRFIQQSVGCIKGAVREVKNGNPG